MNDNLTDMLNAIVWTFYQDELLKTTTTKNNLIILSSILLYHYYTEVAFFPFVNRRLKQLMQVLFLV